MWLKVVSPCQLYFPMVPWSLAIIRQRQREPETPERNHGVWASLPDTPHWGPLPAVNTDTSSAHSVCFSSSMTTFTFLGLDCIVWKAIGLQGVDTYWTLEEQHSDEGMKVDISSDEFFSHLRVLRVNARLRSANAAKIQDKSHLILQSHVRSIKLLVTS